MPLNPLGLRGFFLLQTGCHGFLLGHFLATFPVLGRRESPDSPSGPHRAVGNYIGRRRLAAQPQKRSEEPLGGCVGSSGRTPRRGHRVPSSADRTSSYWVARYRSVHDELGGLPIPTENDSRDTGGVDQRGNLGLVEEHDASVDRVAGDPSGNGPTKQRPCADPETGGDGLGLGESTACQSLGLRSPRSGRPRRCLHGSNLRPAAPLSNRAHLPKTG